MISPSVTPPAGSRLEQLHALYAERKAAADAATAQLREVTDGIKSELSKAAPGEARVELVSGHGPRLALHYVESHRVDSKRLKAEDPETYVRYSTKTGTWRLEPVKGDV